MDRDSVSPLAMEALPPDLQALLAGHVEHLSNLGVFVQSLEQRLPERIATIVAITVAGDTGNGYERVQRERRALAAGMDPREVSALATGALHPFPSFSREERAAHALATCVTKQYGHGCQPAFLRVKRAVGDDAAAACLLMCAGCLAHSTIANVLGLSPPIESPLAG